MDKLHHELWIVHAINAVLGPIVAPGYRALGFELPADGKLIPDHIAILLLLFAALVALSLLVRSRLSVENPGKLQIVIEDAVNGLYAMLDMLVGPKGRQYLPLIGTVFLLIWVSNMAGLVPGLMAPTANINMTVGCAILVWVYYHIEGIRAQGLFNYLKHFAFPPGFPKYLAPLMLIIEPISHMARALSLSLRLFGNVFGEELVILILASLIPFLIPLPIMFLSVLMGTLQAGIFAMLTMIYLGGAVATEHEHEGH